MVGGSVWRHATRRRYLRPEARSRPRRGRPAGRSGRPSSLVGSWCRRHRRHLRTGRPRPLGHAVPVVVDLWAPWCGPCKTLGPILEDAVAATDGAVELAKVNVDENPQVSAAFQVQSIPAVFALRDGKVVDGFIGALPEAQVAEFVDRLAPAPVARPTSWSAAGDEASLRQALELEPDHPGAVVGAGPTPDRPRADRRGPASSWPASPRRPSSGPWPPRPAWPSQHVAVGDDVDRAARRAAGAGARRRGGPPGVPRPARDPGPRRPPHGPLPQGAGRPALLMAGGRRRRAARRRPGRRPGRAPRPRGPHLRHHPPGPGHGDLEPDARLLLRPGRHLRPRRASCAGPSSWWPRAPTSSTWAG